MSSLDHLRELVYHDKSGDWLDRAWLELLGERCLLLRVVEEARRMPEVGQAELLAALLELLDSPEWSVSANLVDSMLLEINHDASPLRARADVIRAAWSSGAVDEIQHHLRQAIERLGKFWPQPAVASTEVNLSTRSDGLPRPAWHAALARDYRVWFDARLSESDWHRMSTHVVGGLLAWLLGRWRRPVEAGSVGEGRYAGPATFAERKATMATFAERKATMDSGQAAAPVRTWVLFAVGDGDRAQGLVGRLRLDRVSRGQGFFYPDPLAYGDLRLDESFLQALQNAWQAVFSSQPAAGLDYDVCWSLKLVLPESGPAWCPRIRGRSGEAAIACALRALRDAEPLDENVAVTAALDEATRFAWLSPVERVLDKLLADQFRRELAHERIRQVVVSIRQPEADRTYDNGQLTVPGVETFPDAYELVSRFAQARRRLRERCDELATTELRELCIGDTEDGFVRPRFSRRVERDRDPLTAGRGEEAQQYEPWSPQTRDALASGDCWLDPQFPRLIRILADSGAGKSMFLAYCDQRMARSSHGFVPLRLKHLSHIPWQMTDPYAVIAEHLPWDGPPLDDAQRLEIVRRLCEQGRLVLLLDAIDQTTTTLGLDHWLDKTRGKLARCPVILTGRPASETLPLFQGQGWVTLRLDKFERAEQEEFLGAECSRRLLPQSGNRGDTAEDEDDAVTRQRKEHWQPLLEVPMLLKMMKQLAEDNRLRDLANREQVYRAATRRLIEKGLEALEETPGQELKLSLDQTERFLARLAWASIGRNNNFTGEVVGAAYTDALEGLAPSLIERASLEASLDEINLFTRYSFLGSRQRDGIEWRHRSFLEYFAALYLCELCEPEERTICIAAVHDNLAAIQRAKSLRRRRRSAERETAEIRPSDQWQWVYRFALSRSAADERWDTSEDLAGKLISHGNPYVVYESMTKDGIEEQLDGDICSLAGWLGQSTYVFRPRKLRGAWKLDAQPEVSIETLRLLRPLFDRRYRNGLVLPPAWQLVEAQLPSKGQPATTELQQVAVAIRDLFFGDLQGTPASGAGLTADERVLLREFLGTFVRCPPDDFDFTTSGEYLRKAANGQYEFRMGASPDDTDAFDNERPRHWVRLSGVEMADFCITNGLLELMDPSHYWYRDEHSRNDDQPALRVSWRTATLYGTWLSEVDARLLPDRGYVYRLPTECEWEFAARGGSGTVYWWGDQFSEKHCNNESGPGRILGRSETTPDHRNGFRLYHMAGNNYQWCLDVFDGRRYAKRTAGSAREERTGEVLGVHPADEGSAGVGGRVCRGGSFDYNAWPCRSSFRHHRDAAYRFGNSGFRLCRVLSASESPSDTLTSDL